MANRSEVAGVPPTGQPELETITTVDQLEAVIGKTPALMRNKAIDFLDEGALRWISKSPLMFASFGSITDRGIDLGVTIGGGPPGWAAGDARELRLPETMLDDPSRAQPGVGFGSVFVLPAISEILRVHGTVAEVRTGEIVITVKDCFYHCGKALLRSEFWAAVPSAVTPSDVSDLVSGSRFMAIATVDLQGRADVSPKGDTAGTMARLEGGRLWFPDRPGNKRVDSFRCILTQPRVAAMLLIPGSPHIAYLTGVAHISTDEATRARFSVREKSPALATRIDNLVTSLQQSPALKRAPLWPVTGAPEGIDPIKMGLAHLKLKKTMGAKLASTVMSVPGLLQKGMEHDYKKNLF
jgi:uncharacterized protein